MKNGTILKLLIIIVLAACLGGLWYFLLTSNEERKETNASEKVSVQEQESLPSSEMQENKEKQSETKSEKKKSDSSSSVEVKGATTITDNQTFTNTSFKSSEGSQNALLVENGGDVTLSNSTVTKTGDASDESADFYGTNAGILVNDNGKLNVSNLEITTNATHANGLFVYGTGEATISDSTIKTSQGTSGGIMVAGGGTLTANNLSIETESRSSAAIRSDRGGGTMIVNGGTYTSHGVGSPAIYSTADITVNDATLVSTTSEGAVVEGKNAITLNRCNLTDSNTQNNGKSTTFKNIFLYQSMSGDASEGTAEFTAKDCTITTNSGDTIFVTNTKAIVNLENNKIVNDDGDFIRIQAGAWGKSGSNGGDVTVNLTNQKVNGNAIVDDISTLVLNLKSESVYTGSINAENTAKQIDLTLDANSQLILTGDSYVTSLTDSDTSYSNINFNGYTLYVNGKAIN